MVQKKIIHSVFLPILLMLAFTIADPAMAMGEEAKVRPMPKPPKWKR